MKYINKFILVLLALFSSWGCSDGFFELYPSNQISVGDFYKTADDFNQAVIVCYAKFQGWFAFDREFCEYRSDNLKIPAPQTSTQDRYDFDNFVETSANGLLSDYWAKFNNNIYRANSVLNRIDGADFDETLKNQYKGEALFVRAWSYYHMYLVWGPVPVTLEIVSPSEALKIGRCTQEEMYKYLSDDLKLAAELLPASYSGYDIGRATSGAALTLLGKVNLTFKKWTEAKDALEQVIGEYSLQSNPGDVFDVNNKMNSEIIFAVRFNKTVEGENHGLLNTTLNPDADETQTDALKNCYTNEDKRKVLISWVPVAGTAGTYIIKKFYDTLDPTTNRAGNDYIWLRYADVLLMYAEALNEIEYNSSSSSPALNALNQVHERAGLNPIQISEVPDQNSFRNAILLERQQEFPYEGQRWFDLVRMGKAMEVINSQGISIQEYQLVYPIPQSELERINDTSLLWQNEGYN